MIKSISQLTPADLIQITGESQTFIYVVHKVWMNQS